MSDLTLLESIRGTKTPESCRPICDQQVNLAGRVIIDCIGWVRQYDDELHAPYVVWDAVGGPVFVCTDDTLYRLSGLESLMLRAACLSFAALDRRRNSQDCKGS